MMLRELKEQKFNGKKVKIQQRRRLRRSKSIRKLMKQELLSKLWKLRVSLMCSLVEKHLMKILTWKVRKKMNYKIRLIKL
jgi:hypothetical protein